MAPRNEFRENIQGFSIAIATNLIAALIYFLISRNIYSLPFLDATTRTRIGLVFLYLLVGIGFSQLLHIVPLSIWLRRRRQFGKLKGIIIGAAITFLICGSCFILFLPILNYYFRW
jgi:hypothetical protein